MLVRAGAGAKAAQRLGQRRRGAADDTDLVVDEGDARIREKQHQAERCKQEDVKGMGPVAGDGQRRSSGSIRSGSGISTVVFTRPFAHICRGESIWVKRDADGASAPVAN